MKRTSIRCICRALRRGAVIGLALAAMGLGSAHADTWLPRPQLWLGQQGWHLGTSIAVRSVLDTGGRVVTRVYVGAPNEPAGAMANAGAVQIYGPGAGGWQPVGTLFSAQPQAGAHFGASLAFSSGNLVVGSPDYNDVGGVGANAGRVEFFSDSGITPPNIVSTGFRNGNGGNFGSAVAVDGNMAAGSVVNAGGGSGCVAGYKYTPGSGWANLPAIGDIVCGSSGSTLGSSIAIRQTSSTSYLLAAGAPGESQNGNLLAGAAHIYIPNPNTGVGGLIEVGTLAADSPTAFDFFGTSIGITDNFVYVGATGRDNGVGRVGSVTVFKPAAVFGYNYVNEYFPSPPATVGGHCGASLSVDPNYNQFILGCPDSTGTLAHEGTARVYRQFELAGQPVWSESVLSIGNALHGADNWGSSVVMSGDRAFVGAPNINFPSPQTGNGGWKEFSQDVIFRNGFQ
ncbi:MAG: hypothetical protein ABI411_16485 [Tahibacter sp.]